MRSAANVALAMLALIAVGGLAAAAQQVHRGDPCCGTALASQGGWMMSGRHGHGMMGMMSGASMARHHAAMMGGVPAPYTSVSNPLPRTGATVDRGAKVYLGNCARCHGRAGLGDGTDGRDLSPPPANLARLSMTPMSNWDPFMYWTVAEGGAPVGSAMPPFKDSLSKDEIWAVIAYIQARLPQTAAE